MPNALIRHQLAIINQLKRYTKKFHPNSPLMEILEKNIGLCLGVTVCQGLFSHFNDIIWWNDTLNLILNWKETNTPLENANISQIKFCETDPRKENKNLDTNTAYLFNENEIIIVGDDINAVTHRNSKEIGVDDEIKKLTKNIFDLNDHQYKKTSNEILTLIANGHIQKTFFDVSNFLIYFQFDDDLKKFLGKKPYHQSQLFKEELLFSYVKENKIITVQGVDTVAGFSKCIKRQHQSKRRNFSRHHRFKIWLAHSP